MNEQRKGPDAVIPIRKPRWPLRPIRRHKVGEPFILSEPFHPAFKIAASLPSREGPEGNAPQAQASAIKKTFFLGVNLLGDLLCTTPTIRAYRKANPDAFITYIVHNATYCRVLDANSDIDQVLYSERLYLDGEKVFSDEAWLRSLPMDLQEPADIYRFNVHEVCRSRPDIFQDNIAVAFSDFVGIPIDSVRPVVCVTAEERRIADVFVRSTPYIVFCMHSTTMVIGRNGELTGKNWSEEKWLDLANQIHSATGFDIIAVGAESDSALDSPYVRNLYGLPIKVVAALLQRAACVVTVESGLMHLCHAVNAPMVVIFSSFVPLQWSNPREASLSWIVYRDPLRISSSDVALAVESILAQGKQVR